MIPKGNLRKLYHPNGVLKEVRYDDSSSQNDSSVYLYFDMVKRISLMFENKSTF